MPLARLTACLSGALLAWLLAALPASAGPTLDGVRQRGALACGVLDLVNTALSSPRADGAWVGLFPELCRGLAAAVLSDPAKVEFQQINIQVVLSAVRAGDVDIASANVTGTLLRDGDGLRFVGPFVYDGQGFLRRHARAEPPADAPMKVCVSNGTTTIANLRSYIAARHPNWTALPFNSSGGRNLAFLGGECDLMTGDRLTLAGFSAASVGGRAAYDLLPEVISREPVGPYVRDDDPQWFALVRWALNALVLAEAKGVTRANADDPATDPEVRLLLGQDPGAGQAVGLDDRWAYRLIRHLGNYGELYEHTIGAGGPLNIDRGVNRLWTQGGMLYPLPFR